mgnify:CR=1 FL=1
MTENTISPITNGVGAVALSTLFTGSPAAANDQDRTSFFFSAQQQNPTSGEITVDFNTLGNFLIPELTGLDYSGFSLFDGIQVTVDEELESATRFTAGVDWQVWQNGGWSGSLGLQGSYSHAQGTLQFNLRPAIDEARDELIAFAEDRYRPQAEAFLAENRDLIAQIPQEVRDDPEAAILGFGGFVLSGNSPLGPIPASAISAVRDEALNAIGDRDLMADFELAQALYNNPTINVDAHRLALHVTGELAYTWDTSFANFDTLSVYGRGGLGGSLTYYDMEYDIAGQRGSAHYGCYGPDIFAELGVRASSDNGLSATAGIRSNIPVTQTCLDGPEFEIDENPTGFVGIEYRF